MHTWKKRTITDYYLKELLVPIFVEGKKVYDIPIIAESKAHLVAEKKTLWPTFKRMINPHVYHVDLSKALWEMKQALLDGDEG